MKNLFALWLAVSCCLMLKDSSLIGQVDQQTENRVESGNKFSYLDVFELEFASGAEVTPDGKRIIYMRNNFDIMNDRGNSDLWMIDEFGNHTPFISSPNGISSPRWSPSGDRLLYVSSDGTKSQIFCYWMATKQSGQLSRLTESPSSLTWSPDGKQIAFYMRVPGSPEPFASMPSKPEGANWAEPPQVIDRMRFRADGRGDLPYGFNQLFVLSADGGSPRQLTDGDFDHGGSICWSNDSRSIIFSANRREDADFQPRNSELYEVNLADGKINTLTERDGPDSNPVRSGDGTTIGFLGFDDKLLGHHNEKLYVCNRDGSSVRCLTENLDRGVSSPQWSPAHNGFLFTYADKGNSKLGLVTLDGNISKLADNLGTNAASRPYGGGDSFSVSNNGVIAFSISTPEHPGDLARIVQRGSVERLTHLNDDLLSHRTLGKTEEIWVKSSHDQQPVQGWVITPPDFDPQKKYPLILEIHGGPFANYGDRFTAELQLMAASGYVVLYMNPRGSTSYGEDFANLIHHKYPGNDYDDLMTGVDELIARGYVDQDQLYVTGGSGGGVLTAWIVGKTDRFRAAVVAKPVINWYSFALTADIYGSVYKYWFPGFPWEHQKEYMERSPISLVGNVKTPTMLLTGAEDLRTPMSETEQYYQALKLLKVDTKLVRIPGAGHGITARPSNLIAKVTYILKWFESHK